MAPTTVYLMVGGRCPHDCGFCAQARSSNAGEVNLSRVTWPRLPTAAVVSAIRERRALFQRLCIQATGSPEAFGDALALVECLRACLDLPVDVSILPPSVEAADRLIAAGVDHVGLGIDAATEPLFARVKGGSMARYTLVLGALAERHPGSAAVHLIAGLGESERDLVEALQRYHDMGAVTALFAFCPVPGTQLARQSPPSLASYRRVQAAHYLVAAGLGRAAGFDYDGENRLVGYGTADVSVLANGDAFRTSGCPGCNRPFYNERPSGPMYNFARPLSAAEAEAALIDTGIAALAAVATEASHA